MEITVKSRYFFENIRGTAEEAALFKKARVISVNSVRMPEEPPFSKQYWTADNVLILRFDDVDDPDSEFQQSGRFMTEADAEAIAGFVESPDQRPIIVHCTAGISRSGAIGASLNEYYNKKCSLNESDHDAFWNRHRTISPNLHVMKLLWKRLQIEI
jgi:predicted protein tyrosine phosphatase